ncbi:hypothetical protein H6P81_015143 [Aristolochia fimbriata]|uniref:Uncharacterized protein n=1 Tax=Aristolochia fimbriata TaxID=158543 RepID=A0AAV7E5C8_ARIFI|nr:hypothetical protein H6P81_015143 [Aristolochia fimbriata]
MASSSSSGSSARPPLEQSIISSTLPIMALKDKIVEKILANRVTLIVGDTGCGKSSQVPQFLLEQNVEPILCTQPRRFAVVAIAKMVAKARNCEVGGEVGYHIGHSKVVSSRSKIIFKTAGVLLDEMVDKGLGALTYGVIILDEVHERSVESDLVLACVKQFMFRKPNLRLVLMSATADISRYRDYFKDIGRDERVEVLAIPSSSQQTLFQRKVVYLDQVIKFLGEKSQNLMDSYISGPHPSCSDTEITREMQILIHDLVLYIHANEPNIKKSILVFLPTYYALVQQWSLLMSPDLSFELHILHSSIDIGKALMAMKDSNSSRKVILATNIAESSVTIPEVAFVIDSCRSLQVFWDPDRKKEAAELVWVSKSQAEQRKGRTGRTCDGEIYRLVTRSFYNSFAEHERPSILRLSLRHQILMICCSESKAINDPKVLLQKALDPPDPEVVKDALSLLIHIHALHKPSSARNRIEPTFYGRLLAGLRLSFDASVFALKFGEIGLLREGILIGVLFDAQPLPILQPFGDDILFACYIGNYFGVGEDMLHLEKRETILMGNFCAFQFWQRVFKDKHRLEHLKEIADVGNGSNLTPNLIPVLEEHWCHSHNLLQASLQHVYDKYEDIVHVIHRFRPQCLVTSNGLPSSYDPCEFKHACLLLEPTVDMDVEIKSCCLSAPYVSSSDFKSLMIAKKLVTIIKEMRLQDRADAAEDHDNKISDSSVSEGMNEPVLCRFFASGSCIWGSECVFSHSLQSKRPMCKFFFSLQGCRNGSSCFFSHDEGPVVSAKSSPSICSPEGIEDNAGIVDNAHSLSSLLPTDANESVLVLDDNIHLNFSFSLSSRFNNMKIIATSSHPFHPKSSVPSSVTVLWEVSQPFQSIIATKPENKLSWECVKCVFWFAKFPVDEQESDEQYVFVQKLFQFLAIRFLTDALHDVRVIVAMNNTKFSQFQVEKLGRECFFFLRKSFAVDESTFGDLSSGNTINRPMQVSQHFFYVFDLHPPSDKEFGDYSSALRQSLYKCQK